MDYFKILNLHREPFSNSPDPDFFFESRQHTSCLQQVELSIRLKRGLNVVIGDVGTGKTTLCRQLIRRFDEDETIVTHLILDPSFSNSSEFLAGIAEIFSGRPPEDPLQDMQNKEIIKKHLFQSGVEEQKITTLIIDEGQKIPVFCLEILREFLNYETNEHKLLQIVIFAQREFQETIQAHDNFADRINLFHHLKPLNFHDTRSMIQFRLNQSSTNPSRNVIFSFFSHIAIYQATGGYPRKIINLCHRSIMTMIIQNKSRAGWFLIRSCVRRAFTEPVAYQHKAVRITALLLLAICVLSLIWIPQKLPLPASWQTYLISKNDHHKPGEALPPRLKTAARTGPLKNNEHNSALAPGESTTTLLSGENGHPANKPAAIASLSPTPVNDGGAIEKTKNAARSPAMPSSYGTGHRVFSSSPENPSMQSNANEDKAPSAISMPAYLGRLYIQEGETLWDLCDIVYGPSNSAKKGFKNIETVLSANAQIIDADRVAIGQAVTFPAIPVNRPSSPHSFWWLEMARFGQFNEAFAFIRSYGDRRPKTQMMPFWSSTEGLQFPVVLREVYFNKPSAQNRLKALRQRGGLEAYLAEMPDENHIFFSHLSGTGG